MPVFLTPPLSLDEAASEWNNLNTAFGLNPVSTGVMATSGVSETVNNGRELTMDPVSGLFYYVDHNLLYTTTAAMSGVQAAIQANDAYTIANTFLTNAGLLPPDAQFYEVAANTISDATNPTRGTGAMSAGTEQVLATTTTDYSVIYSRILTYTVMGATASRP